MRPYASYILAGKCGRGQNMKVCKALGWLFFSELIHKSKIQSDHGLYNRANGASELIIFHSIFGETDMRKNSLLGLAAFLAFPLAACASVHEDYDGEGYTIYTDFRVESGITDS